uniref:tape measure protein n=1 Tax=Gemmatimonas sp. TaxID=1962908 RepID=UPI0033414EBC
MDLSTLKLVVDGEQGTRAIERYDRSAQKADKSSRLLDEATAKLSKAFGLLGGAAAALKVLQIADQYSTLNARLALATRGSSELAVAQQRLFAIAQNTRQPLADVVNLYAKLGLSAGELGVSQDRLLKFTEGVNKALLLSGTAGAQASGALQQLLQALGSGIVRAEEFNSILDGAPRVLKAVADGFDGGALSVAQLRQRVIEGQVTSVQFFEAFERGAKKIDTEAAKIPTTAGGAFTQLSNVFGKAIADLDRFTGSTAGVVGGINALTNGLTAVGQNLGLVIGATGTLAAVFAGRWLGKAVTDVREYTQGLVKARAETVAYQEENKRNAAIAVQSTQAELRAAAAREKDLLATRAAIQAERELATARLQAANARIARAVDPQSLAPLGGAVVARETEAQARAAQQRSTSLAQLAQLGQQQTRVEREMAVAANATAAANLKATGAQAANAAAIAGVSLAARAGTVAVGAFNAVVGFLGGPVGAAITAALAGFAFFFGRQREEAEKARKATEDYVKAADGLSSTARTAAIASEIALQRQLADALPKTAAEFSKFTRESLQDAAAQITASKDRVKALQDIAKAEQDLVRQRAAAAPGELAREYETLTAKLNVFRRSGTLAAEAFEQANQKFADGSGKARSFAQALDQGDAAAKALYANTLRNVTAANAFTKATEAATESERKRKEVKEALKALEADYQAQVVQLGIELAERAHAAEEERAKAITGTDTALRQLAVAQTAKDDALRAEIAALNGGIGAGIEYARQQQIIAIATERMNEARAKGIPLTNQVILGILAEAANTQKLVETRNKLEQINGTNLKTLFEIPGDTTKTVRDLDGALQSVSGTLRDLSQALNGTGNDAVKMLGVLAAALDGLARAQKRAEEMRKAGQTVSGGQRAAIAVGGAIGAFGSGYAVGSMTTSRTAGAIGGALSGAATGASAGASIGAVTGPGAALTAGIGAAIGALIGGVGGLLGASKNATQELIAQRAAQQQLNEALASLRASFANDALGNAIAQARAQFSQLRQQTEAAFSGK